MFKILSLIIISLLLLCCSKSSQQYNGYVVANLSYISTPVSGKLVKLMLHRGQQVRKGQLLFRIDKQPYLAEMQQASDAVAEANANLLDLLNGARDSEIAEIKANIAASEAKFIYAEQQLARDVQLLKTNSIQQQALDLSKKNAEVAKFSVAALNEKLITAKLPARKQVIIAAKAKLAEANAALRASSWKLAQTVVTAPRAAMVFDNYYWPNEQVVAAKPVVSLLIPSQERAVFFVPEPDLSKIKLGQKVYIAIHNKQISKADISFISQEAEYPPPVIYSEQRQSELVYRVEASFADNLTKNRIKAGEPVTVSLAQ